MHFRSPNKYYFINKFDTNLLNKQDKHTAFIYRNYDKKNFNKNLISKLRDFCKKKGNKFYLANNIKLAINLKLNGVYIPSFNKQMSHLGYNLPKNFEILGSSHNISEIRIKELQKVSILFISSLFKKNKNFLGIYKFKNLKNLTKKNIIALGGISKKNLNKLNLVNCEKFAGISFFE